eukprot:Skav212544  [mRNA]  locus=scaffold1851:526662:527808:+ [translate_table: standard]
MAALLDFHEDSLTRRRCKSQLGDDVTVDYDGQVRCHSFEDFRLKFTHYKIGHRVTIMSGASVPELKQSQR